MKDLQRQVDSTSKIPIENKNSNEIQRLQRQLDSLKAVDQPNSKN